MSNSRQQALAEHIQKLGEGFEKPAKECKHVANEVVRAAEVSTSSREELVEDIAKLKSSLSEAEDFHRLMSALGDFDNVQRQLILSSADPAATFLQERKRCRKQALWHEAGKVETAIRLLPDDEEGKVA